jgi:hypothetical protein
MLLASAAESIECSSFPRPSISLGGLTSPSPWPAAVKFQSDGHLTASAINQMAQLSELEPPMKVVCAERRPTAVTKTNNERTPAAAVIVAVGVRLVQHPGGLRFSITRSLRAFSTNLPVSTAALPVSVLSLQHRLRFLNHRHDVTGRLC